jgi:hypothetical protein
MIAVTMRQLSFYLLHQAFLTGIRATQRFIRGQALDLH